jgi:aspartate racemase
MHKVFDEMQSKTDLPFIHILEPTIKEIKKVEVKKVGLLGTKFTMSENFYKDELSKNGITPIVPNFEQQEIVHRIIVEELVRGIITDESRKQYLEVIDDLISFGAEGIILGCTEIPLLISQEDCNVTTFDTAVLHSDAALHFAIMG